MENKSQSFTKISTISAEYKILTPVLRAAEEGEPTISSQSFKGAMRFWWRATNWGRIRKDTKTSSEALRKLHEEEAILFGSSAKKPNTDKIYGQGAFSLKIKKKKFDFSSINVPAYIAYGAVGEHKKKHTATSNTFEVIISLHLKHTSEQIEELLKIMGYFANLGAKSRNGFGSIQLIKLNEDDDIKLTQGDIEKEIKRLKNYPLEDYPPYTAFSNKTYYDLSLLSGNKVDNILKNFSEKYQALLKGKGLKGSEQYKKKILTGLPKEGYSSDLRRTKGLYFHVYKDNDNHRYHILALTFPTSIYHYNPEIDILKHKDYENFVVNLKGKN
jgi:CRISPR-associated protein Cmr1